MKFKNAFSALAMCALGGGLATAATVSLTSVRDNTLYENATGNISNGAGAGMIAGRTNQASNSKRRAVVAFNVASAVPAGATVTSASLFLVMTQTSSAAQNIELRRLTANWGEGTSDAGANPGNGAGATTGDATWVNTFFNTSSWTTLGGDFSATVTDTQSVNAVGTYAWSGAQLVADVQAMKDTPAADFGWILIGNEAAQQTTKTFGTHEHLTVGSRPVLTIEFTPGAGVSEWSVY